MLGPLTLVLITLTYVGVLFAIAWFGDRQSSRGWFRRLQPLIYSLSLAVYCTSWTFYGAVGSAATTGWGFLPIYLGPALMMLFGYGLLRRVVRLSRQQRITSIADFIAFRFGRDRSLAVMTALAAVIGSVPYIALQLKAISSGIEIGAGLGDSGYGWVLDPALYVALALALFSILFGTRELDASEHHRGMVLAIAFESVVKLLAFVAVGLFAVFALAGESGGVIGTIRDDAALRGLFMPVALPEGFWVQTLLAMAAIICLPRQFHVAVVENTGDGDLRMARWFFPLYLGVFTVFVIPIAVAGMTDPSVQSLNPDTFVISLPLAADQDALALLAFLGGFSAATGMVIVATIALATMISNDVILPLRVRFGVLNADASRGLSQQLLIYRRLTILAITLVAYVYLKFIDETAALASIGLLSFAAAAQFAPALIIGVYWRAVTRNAARAAIGVGIFLWVLLLLLPTISSDQAPLPGALWPVLGIRDLLGSPLNGGVLMSLLANTLVLIGVSLLERRRDGPVPEDTPNPDGPAGDSADPDHGWLGGLSPSKLLQTGDLIRLARHFIGERRAHQAFARFDTEDTAADALATPAMLQFTETLLAGSIGAASARTVMAAALRRRGVSSEEALQLLDQTSQAIQFNRGLLETTLNNISQGVSVVDRDLRVVGWNRRYIELFDFPEGMVYPGCPVEDLLRYNAARGLLGSGNTETRVRRRLQQLRAARPYHHERQMADGRVIEIRGNPMPGGRYVTTYTDISRHKAVQAELREQEASLRIYTDNAPAMLTYVDSEHRIRFANRAYLERLGLQRDDLLGQRLQDMLPETEWAQRSNLIEAALAGQRQEFELELTRSDRQPIYALGTYIPDRGETGAVRGFFAIFQDISTRRRAELALQEVNETLEQRVVQRTRELEAALTAARQARQQAEQANQSKSRFLAATSHDLMQPLNAARLFAAVLHEDQSRFDDPELRQLVSRLDYSLKAAEELLDGLLEISKLDTGKQVPTWSRLRIADLMGELEQQFAEMARRKQLKLRVRAVPATIRTDPRMLRRILQNFLVNALRYTERGGVLLAARRRGDQVEVGVWDTGPGIAEADQQRIFEEFQRLDRGGPREETGLGLGLAIAERMANLLSHPLKLHSRVGRGSVFTVRAPLLEWGVHSVAPALPASSPGGDGMAGSRVLVVDDEADVCAGMAALLERWDCRVETCNSVAEVRRLQSGIVGLDFLLVDYHLGPGNGAEEENGIDLARSLTPAFDPPPAVILITADREPALVQVCEAEGFGLLLKPVKPPALKRMMRTLARRRQRRQAAG